MHLRIEAKYCIDALILLHCTTASLECTNLCVNPSKSIAITKHWLPGAS